MQSAGDVYSLMASDQVVGAFLCDSGSELVAPLLVSRRSSSPRVGVKNDADLNRCMWRGCHTSTNLENVNGNSIDDCDDDDDDYDDC